jgi:tRNA pseudouridine65 synthase
MSQGNLMSLNVLFHDESLIAIHKPAGLLVHRSNLDAHEDQAAVQILRDQIKAKVFPVHRLDRPTSGVLIFALSSKIAAHLSAQFANQQVEKKYLALVRGYLEKEIDLDYPLKEELDEISDFQSDKNKQAQSARTLFRPLAQIELPYAVDRYPSSRYSFIEAIPKTGRKHQIRRHLKHLHHPIIGDVNHGNGKHNQFFHNEFKIKRLLLHCAEISFTHPETQQSLKIQSNLCQDFHSLIKKFGWSLNASA